MCFGGRQVVTTAVSPDIVIGINCFVEQGQCGFKTRIGIANIKLIFDNSVYAFSNGIFIRVAIIGHADGDTVLFQQRYIFLAAILNSPVGVMDEWFVWRGTLC